MELKKANIMFMALELEPGKHEISLHYKTPYIEEMFLLSILGVISLAAITFYTEKKLKKEI